jgi:predicted DNA-binding transcriptional regulator AlpA
MTERRTSVGAGLDLPPVDAIVELSADALAAAALQLAVLQSAVAVRLVTGSVRNDGPDRLLTVKQAAPILGMSTDWLYRNADALPFTRRTGRRTVRFSERALRRYLAERDA